ncbi:MAG: phosphatidylglycerol lysyltransferase domain-containing protein [Candidatus Omnitrophica bacterium]|nr:phosphatidylglycerol lysyltransferase domain-containing protein [Candidatus Omnitrophota bacterium]
MNTLAVKDKPLFNRYLMSCKHELSVYAFANIYIWKGLFDIRWSLIQNTLCVFFIDATGCFLYVPPLGEYTDPHVIAEVFRIMDAHNKHKAVSRIENVYSSDIALYREWGYKDVLKSVDYVCRRNELSGLRGDRFKSKRACCNYFIKHYNFKYRPFSSKDAGECLKVYEQWRLARSAACADTVYRGMMDDSRKTLVILLDNYREIDCQGRVVTIDEEIKAFTFGFELNTETFCVLYEVADLSIRGISQFIFRRFSDEMKQYEYINIMDDSGLKNLSRVKESYHPVKKIPSYLIARHND